MKEIIFCPLKIKIDRDPAQGIWFVYLKTKPFETEGEFVEKNQTTGQYEKKFRKSFSRLKLNFTTSSKEIDNFQKLVKTEQFYQVKFQKGNNVFSGKIGSELKEYYWVHDDNPQVQELKEQVPQEKDSKSIFAKKSWLIGVGGLILLYLIFFYRKNFL